MKATPTARVLLSIRNRKWSVPLALAELLDNAFGELRGRASSVWLAWDPMRRYLTILDDGQGMNDVIDLFTLGKGQSSGQGDVGLYGVGGSEALLWLGDSVDVTTLRAATGRVAHGVTDWARCIADEEFPEIDRRWREASVTTCPTELLALNHGTLIRIAVRPGIKIHPDVIQERLSRLFGMALRSERQITWTSREKHEAIETALHAWNPGVLEDAITATVTLENGLSASIHAGSVPNLSIANSKLSVNYVYRQVKETTAGFGRPVQGAVGNVDLSPEWLAHLTTTKDDIREDSRALEEELMAKIEEVLEPLIQKLHRAKWRRILANIRINLTRRFSQGFEEQGAEKPDPSPRPEGGTHHSSGPSGPHRQKRIAELDIEEASDADIGGLLCKVEIDGDYVLAFINVDHPLVKIALESEPANQRLLEHVVMTALAVSIVEQDKTVTFGLMSADEKSRLEETETTKSSMVLLLTRRLIDRIVTAA